MDVVIKTAMGVLLALILLFFIRVAYINYFISEVTSSISEITDRQQQRAEAKEFRIQQQKQARELETKTEQEKVRRKELAWSEFYKQPEECLSYRSEKHMVECGNIRIRAKTEFDRLWDGGGVNK